MFFSQPMEVKREILVNLLEDSRRGRGKFIEKRYGLSRSERWEVQHRMWEAVQMQPLGRPRSAVATAERVPCAHCAELKARLSAVEQERAEAEMRGRRRLALQAAVLPNSIGSIVLLEEAAFGNARGRETIRTQIHQACERAASINAEIPWAEYIDRLAADEVFANKMPILVTVEPRSMAVPALQRGPDRTAETWRKVLEKFPLLSVVSSDQGPGLLAAVAVLALLSQGDPLHTFQDLDGCLGKLEREAYQRIREEYRAKAALEKAKRLDRPSKRLHGRYQEACRVAMKAIRRFDRAFPARGLIQGAIALFDERGRWLSYARSAERIQQGLSLLDAVEAPRRKSVARACDPVRLLNFKAVLEAALECDESLGGLSAEDVIEVAQATTGPCPSEPLAALRWTLLQTLDRRLAAQCPTWPLQRQRILDELVLPFRSSSWVESVNSRLRVDQQVLKHLHGVLALWALWHNATPFRGGKRQGKSPLEILGIPMPSGTWLDWVDP